MYWEILLPAGCSSDEFYLSDSDYNGLEYNEDKRLYTWMPDYVSTNQG